jgi:uncharacterized protein involved in exopolysaccharide biosynthesis
MSESNLSGDAVELGGANRSSSDFDARTIRDDRGRAVVATATRTSAASSQEIRVRDLYALFARSKWLIIGLTAAMTAAAIAAAFILPKEYRATTVLAPVTPDQNGKMESGSLGSVISQFSGLASMVGLGEENSEEAQDVATLKSQVLTRRFIQENNLLPILYAKKWDARTGHWRTNDPERIPTLWKANQFFKDRVRTVTEDKETGLIKLSVTWTDANLAAQWANGLVAMTNDYLRNKELDQANRNIAYLEQKVQKTSLVGVQQGIYTLLQEEIGDAMVAQGKREYALKVIDPAFAPEKPYSPDKRLWALGGLLAGLLLSCGIVVFRASWAASS